MENRRKPCMTRLDLQCQCGLLWQAVISGLSFDKGNLVGDWKGGLLLTEKYLVDGTDECLSVLAATRKPDFSFRKWGKALGLFNKVTQSYQMTHTITSCPVLSLFWVLSSSHPCAHHFCLSLFLPFFSPRLLPSFCLPTFNASPSFAPWTEPKSSLLSQADVHQQSAPLP